MLFSLPQAVCAGAGKPNSTTERIYGHYSDPRDRPSDSRRWCGLRSRTAIAIAALIALLITGAVVGGTVGGLMAKPRDDKSNVAGNTNSTSFVPSSTATTTPTSTTSTSTAFPSPSNHILPLNCPAINNTQYTIESSQSFFIYCSIDLKSGSKNVQNLREPSLDDCINSCVHYTANHTEAPCQGLTFGANLTRRVSTLTEGSTN